VKATAKIKMDPGTPWDDESMSRFRSDAKHCGSSEALRFSRE
jgi:hypothetical protein